MNAEEIAEEICEILCENAEEPAGRGCGYGITEDGQDELKAFIELKRSSIMSGTEEKMHNVSIDVRTEVFDTTQRRVTETTRVSAIGNDSGILRLGGITPLVSVLKAYETVRAKANVKGNLNNLEIGVDGVPFCG